MKELNTFVPDYLKRYNEKPKVSKKPVVVQKSAETDLEIRNEKILNQPILINEHYIKGEQRKALEFFKEECIKFAIVPNNFHRGKYVIIVYGRDKQTNQNFSISVGEQGIYQT